jgi:hypothetical protein
MPWSRRFDDPVTLPDGRPLRTLRDAGRYIAGLPKATQARPEWQAATEALLMAAEDRGPLLHARVGMLRAIHHGRPAPPLSRKKLAKAYKIVGSK